MEVRLSPCPGEEGVVLGSERGPALTRPRRQRSSFRAPTQPRRARPMVRTPEMASALDQICSGMKDKPRGGEAVTPGLLCTAPGSPTHAGGSSILGASF